jgi:hypothetical protein
VRKGEKLQKRNIKVLWSDQMKSSCVNDAQGDVGIVIDSSPILNADYPVSGDRVDVLSGLALGEAGKAVFPGMTEKQRRSLTQKVYNDIGDRQYSGFQRQWDFAERVSGSITDTISDVIVDQSIRKSSPAAEGYLTAARRYQRQVADDIISSTIDRCRSDDRKLEDVLNLWSWLSLFNEPLPADLHPDLIPVLSKLMDITAEALAHPHAKTLNKLALSAWECVRGIPSASLQPPQPQPQTQASLDQMYQDQQQEGDQKGDSDGDSQEEVEQEEGGRGDSDSDEEGDEDEEGSSGQQEGDEGEENSEQDEGGEGEGTDDISSEDGDTDGGRSDEDDGDDNDEVEDEEDEDSDADDDSGFGASPIQSKPSDLLTEAMHRQVNIDQDTVDEIKQAIDLDREDISGLIQHGQSGSDVILEKFPYDSISETNLLSSGEDIGHALLYILSQWKRRKSKWYRGADDGNRIDSRLLYRGGLQDNHVFKTRETKDKLDMALCLMLDESGSITPEQWDIICRSSGAFANATGHRDDIDLMIMSYTGSSGTNIRRIWDTADRKLRLSEHKHSGSTPSGYALAAIRDVVLKRYTKRRDRVIIHITDGAPDRGQPLIDEANRCRAAGIYVGCILVYPETITQYGRQVATNYDRHYETFLSEFKRAYGDGFTRISSYDDLPVALENIMRNLLSKR